MYFQVVMLATCQKPGRNLNVIKLPLSRGMPIKIVGLKKGNTKIKKNKNVDKTTTTKPLAPGGKVEDAGFHQDFKLNCAFQKTTKKQGPLVNRECALVGIKDNNITRKRTTKFKNKGTSMITTT
jgi:hypothetical protein